MRTMQTNASAPRTIVPPQSAEGYTTCVSKSREVVISEAGGLRCRIAAANVSECGKKFEQGTDLGQAGLLAEGPIEFTVLRQTVIEASFPVELP
jgi:hypothetical protein